VTRDIIWTIRGAIDLAGPSINLWRILLLLLLLLLGTAAVESEAEALPLAYAVGGVTAEVVDGHCAILSLLRFDRTFFGKSSANISRLPMERSRPAYNIGDQTTIMQCGRGALSPASRAAASWQRPIFQWNESFISSSNRDIMSS
jgi:hypothetical protein